MKEHTYWQMLSVDSENHVPVNDEEVHPLQLIVNRGKWAPMFVRRQYCMQRGNSYGYYYHYVIRTLGATTDKIDRRTDRHTENKHKTTHYR